MLFNKNDNGASEIKSLIGWIYKSNSFANLATYIKMAERDIIRLVGIGIYNFASNWYHSERYEDPREPDQANDDLVHALQLPIALFAYRRYAPGADLSHSEAGRQITVTEELKPAFEWMIKRDNQNITDLAYEATDMLLEYLDSCVNPNVDMIIEEEVSTNGGVMDPPISPSIIGDLWAGSIEYKLAKSLFINSALEFDQVFPIKASRMLYLSLVPFIREVELRHIAPAILASRYEVIKERIRDKDLTEEDKRIIELSKVPIALLTMSTALKRLSMELLPDSIVQNFTAVDASRSHTADSDDRRGLSALLERDGKRELIPLQNYIASLSEPAPVTETIIDNTQPFFMA